MWLVPLWGSPGWVCRKSPWFSFSIVVLDFGGVVDQVLTDLCFFL